MKRKALLLIELSVLIIATVIVYMAVSNGMSGQNHVISRMSENNDVLFILDCLADKIKMDYESGVDFNNKEIIDGYNDGLKESYYSVALESNEKGNVELVLSVLDSSRDNTIRKYRREVLLNEK